MLVPVGHLAAFAAILLVGALLKVRRLGRLLALAIAFGAAVPLWYVPGSVFPEALRYTGWGNFILGFSPVAAAGLLVLLAYRKASSGAAA
ncbi:MAG: hypothetical protein K0Q68_3167 [Moraxellaceae bacterium]|nr:hypothetical protein [Moraxellaceae bacterium]